MGAPRPIDGVDVWPLLTGTNTTQPRAATPTTEVSLIDTSGGGGAAGSSGAAVRWWKLITLAGQSNYYLKNQTNVPGTDGCLAGAQPDPPQPGRTDPLVNGRCPVCNETRPCLYDLLADP